MWERIGSKHVWTKASTLSGAGRQNRVCLLLTCVADSTHRARFHPGRGTHHKAAANCTIIDHFSAFESGLVAPFLYAA